MLRECIHLFFPRLCPACGRALLRREHVICFICRYRLPRTNYHLLPDNPVARLFWGRVPLAAAAACFFFRKEGKVQQLLHALKYRDGQEVGREIGRIYGCDLVRSSIYRSAELIVPVPLHPEKQRTRGYNQSEVFGEGLSESMQVPQLPVHLVRSLHSETQTRKTRYARWENVESAFVVRRPEAFSGKHVLLIDDVVTTGATLESCAVQLVKAGVSRLSIACIAAPVR